MSEERKRAAIELIRASYLETDALFRSLTADELDRPVFTGEGPGWRVRDLIAHYAYWQTLSARAAEKMATGVMPGPDERIRPFLGIAEEVDAVNDGTFQAWRDRPAVDALAHLRRANDRLIAALEALPSDRILTGNGSEDFHRHFWQPGVNHLRQHREHIDSALKEATSS
ncbi:MAG TPA: maleylpyruvate isomerase N-terminal domain-containing protein [Candidatus Limnocylindria bacterium]|nr:maleylpyruvate isomerase N-terminal domain-containing protein [Candidatus Limnocylindria bacterium]